jgi:hypothetical protein
MSELLKESPALGESSGLKNRTLNDAFDTKNPRQKNEVPQAVNLPSHVIEAKRELLRDFAHEAATQAENDSAAGQFNPLPSFFELVTQNAEEPMRRAAAWLRICAELGNISDYDGYCEAGDKFLDAARDFAKLHSLLKTPTIFSNERADRLEEKALALHNLADLTEMEASRIRQVVRL